MSQTSIEWSRYFKKIFDDKSNQQRKFESKLFSEYYDGVSQKDLLTQEMNRIFENKKSIASKRKITQNITKAVVDAMALSYGGIVKRNVAKLGNKQQETVADTLWSDINSKMSSANRLLVGQRTVLLQAYWSQKHSKVKYACFPQYQFDIIFDEDSEERELSAVIISDYKPNDFDNTNYKIYTKDTFFRFTGHNLKEEIQHNNNFLPFVLAYAQEPGLDVEYLSPLNDLVNANLELNLALSGLLHLLHRQAHGVMVLTTYDAFSGMGHIDGNASSTSGNNVSQLDRHIQTGVDKVVHLKGSPADTKAPSLSYVQQNPNFIEAIEVIKHMLSSISLSLGLPADTLQLEVTGGGMSATEFYIKDRRTRNLIQHYSTIFTNVETELFEKGLLIAEKEMQLPSKVSSKNFSIEFHHEEPLSKKLTSQESLSLFEKGIIDEVEVIRHIYSHLNRPEAEAFLKQMQDSQNKLDQAKVQEPEPAPDKQKEE